MAYEIAVACDITLGQVVRNTPGISTIEIDPQAAAEVLAAVTPETADTDSRDLLLIASHYQSLRSRWADQNSHTLGSFMPARRSNGYVATAKVVISGDPTDVSVPDTEAFTTTMNAALAKNLSFKKLAKVMKTVTEPKPFIDEDSIQEKAVHELSHAADKLDSAATREVLKYRYTRTAMLAGPIVALNSLILGVYNTDSVEQLSQDRPAVSIAQIGLSILANCTALKLSTRRGHESYLAAPGEVRARKHEQLASEYPQVIKIQ